MPQEVEIALLLRKSGRYDLPAQMPIYMSCLDLDLHLDRSLNIHSLLSGLFEAYKFYPTVLPVVGKFAEIRKPEHKARILFLLL